MKILIITLIQLYLSTQCSTLSALAPDSQITSIPLSNINLPITTSDSTKTEQNNKKITDTINLLNTTYHITNPNTHTIHDILSQNQYFAQSTIKTQAYYLMHLFKRAKKMKLEPEPLAQSILELTPTQIEPDQNPRSQDIGYFLLDPKGIKILNQTITHKNPRAKPYKHTSKTTKIILYYMCRLFITVVISSIFFAVIISWHPWWWTTILITFVILTIFIGISNPITKIFIRITKTDTFLIPELEITTPLSESQRTFIVYTVLSTDISQVDDVLHTMKKTFNNQQNVEKNCQFILLSNSKDKNIIEYEQQQFKHLIQHSPYKDNFIYIHQNPAATWEKKRGALLQFNLWITNELQEFSIDNRFSNYNQPNRSWGPPPDNDDVLNRLNYPTLNALKQKNYIQQIPNRNTYKLHSGFGNKQKFDKDFEKILPKNQKNTTYQTLLELWENTPIFDNIIATDNTLTMLTNPEYNVPYIIAVDNDSILDHNAVNRLIGMKTHPFNTPIIDTEKNIVKEGWGIIEPTIRITNSADSSYANIFQRLHDAWHDYTPDYTYENIAKESLFKGKGIWNTHMFSRLFLKKLPLNVVLSHDVIEGAIAKTITARDIFLFEDYPPTPLDNRDRSNRWIRGDTSNLVTFSSSYYNNETTTKTYGLNFLQKIDALFSKIKLWVILPLLGFSLLALYILQNILFINTLATSTYIITIIIVGIVSTIPLTLLIIRLYKKTHDVLHTIKYIFKIHIFALVDLYLSTIFIKNYIKHFFKRLGGKIDLSWKPSAATRTKNSIWIYLSMLSPWILGAISIITLLILFNVPLIAIAPLTIGTLMPILFLPFIIYVLAINKNEPLKNLKKIHPYQYHLLLSIIDKKFPLGELGEEEAMKQERILEFYYKKNLSPTEQQRMEQYNLNRENITHILNLINMSPSPQEIKERKNTFILLAIYTVLLIASIISIAIFSATYILLPLIATLPTIGIWIALLIDLYKHPSSTRIQPQPSNLQHLDLTHLTFDKPFQPLLVSTNIFINNEDGDGNIKISANDILIHKNIINYIYTNGTDNTKINNTLTILVQLALLQQLDTSQSTKINPKILFLYTCLYSENQKIKDFIDTLSSVLSYEKHINIANAVLENKDTMIENLQLNLETIDIDTMLDNQINTLQYLDTLSKAA